MKTLDEVIKSLELCKDDDNPCDKCPYTEFDKNGVWACSMCGDWADDALHYLKIFQAHEKRVREQLEDLKEEFRPNDPLTWDELRTMEGKPVWVEYNLHLSDKKARSRMWIIVQKIMPWKQDDELIYYSGFVLGKKEIGKAWQAYRKERS